MKALTLTQPWATLVAIGAKRIETRSWRTNYTGPVAIHAARNKRDGLLTMHDEPFRSVLDGVGIREGRDLPCGVVLATVRLIGCRRTEDVASQLAATNELAFGDYSPGRWAWFFDLGSLDVLDEPIPAKGALGLWEWTPPWAFKP